MHPANFDAFLEKKMRLIEATLKGKADEYATIGDRLANFKHSGALLECTPERALLGIRVKHEVAMTDYVNALDAGQMVPFEWFDEKIGDNIAYLFLLWALVEERKPAMKRE